MIELFDYDGALTSGKVFYGVYPFSDGVAWSTVTQADKRNSQYSLINHKGDVLFKLPNQKNKLVSFSEGIGFYTHTLNSNTWYAIDKRGQTLFTIDAYSIYPATCGLIPVYKGTTYSNMRLGFVDKKGKTVIPFVYTTNYYPQFGSDSLIKVSLNGIDGVLHVNRTFTPNNK